MDFVRYIELKAVELCYSIKYRTSYEDNKMFKNFILSYIKSMINYNINRR